MDRFERPQQEGIFEIKITDTAKAHLLETARWAKFLATISIIVAVLGSLVFFGSIIIGASALNSTAPTFIGGAVAYIIIIALYIYPIVALYKFASLTKRAFAHGNQGELEKALWYQKNMFKFLGIITIIMLVLYGLAIIMIIAGVAMNA